MWVIVILLLSLIIIPSKLPTPSFARDPFYRVPCHHDDDCDHSSTHLRCLKASSSKPQKICVCQHLSKYDNAQQKCYLTLDQGCEVNSEQKCDFGLYCKPYRDSSGNPIEEGACTPCQENNGQSCNPPSLSTPSIDPSPSALVASNESPLDSLCVDDSSCQSSRTFLRCLKYDKNNRKCSCGAVGKFDLKRQMCVLHLGAECQLPSDSDPAPQECEDPGSCKPRTTIYGHPSPDGICCDSTYTKVCNDFDTRSQNPSSPKLSDENEKKVNKTCSTDLDCDEEITHLKCLQSGQPGGGKVCHCGRNNFWLDVDAKCFLGIGQECLKPVFYNQNPQQCASHGICKFHKTLEGKEEDKGACVCKTEARHEQCQGIQEDLNGMACTSQKDCERPEREVSFLKCLKAGKKFGKVCDCGHNRVYDKSVKKCLLGIGHHCQVQGKSSQSHSKNSLVRGNEINRVMEEQQQCIENAICLSRGHQMEAQGEGTCVCRHGSSQSQCDAFSPVPPIVDNMKQSSSSAWKFCLSVILKIFIFLMISCL